MTTELEPFMPDEELGDMPELPAELLAMLPEHMNSATVMCTLAFIDMLRGGNTTLPAHCAMTAIEYQDSNGNGLLDFRVSIDPAKFVAEGGE